MLFLWEGDRDFTTFVRLLSKSPHFLGWSHCHVKFTGHNFLDSWYERYWFCFFLTYLIMTMTESFLIALYWKRKYFIYRTKLKKTSFKSLFERIKNMFQIERFIATKNNKLQIHYNKWKPLLQLIEQKLNKLLFISICDTCTSLYCFFFILVVLCSAVQCCVV